MNSKKGSVFVEAALIIPMVVLISVLLINISLGLYKKLYVQVDNHVKTRSERLVDGALNNGECEFARKADLFIDEKL